MAFRQVLFLIVLLVESVLVELAKHDYNSQTSNGQKSLDNILYRLEETLELRDKIKNLETQFDLKVKDLELQNAQNQASLNNLKTILSDTIKELRSVRNLPRNCKEIQDSGLNVTNIYRIKPSSSSGSFLVLCDMKTMGGGWTYVMNRFDGSLDFDMTWKNYKDGFGNLASEFWLGLENLHQLTANGPVNELLIELIDWNLQKAYATYGSFSVGSEKEGYSLKILAQYSGNAGDNLSKHVGNKFSARDWDQDNDNAGNCARYRYGGWWYDNCFYSKLTGKYLKGKLKNNDFFKGIHWHDFYGNNSLKEARMMVRPRGTYVPLQLPHEIVG